MSIASDYSTRYNNLPVEWVREMDIWGGDCSVPRTMHYGEPFKTFFHDLKEVAVETKYNEEYDYYIFKFSDGSSAVLNNFRETFQSRS